MLDLEHDQTSDYDSDTAATAKVGCAQSQYNESLRPGMPALVVPAVRASCRTARVDVLAEAGRGTAANNLRWLSLIATSLSRKSCT